MLWLLAQGIFEAMQEARAKHSPTVAELEAHEKTYALGDEDTPRIMSVAGETAAIQINGVLTDQPDFFARFWGGGNTTYREIVAALALADADESEDLDLPQRSDVPLRSKGSLRGLTAPLLVHRIIKHAATALERYAGGNLA